MRTIHVPDKMLCPRRLCLPSPDLLHRPSPSAGQRHCSEAVSRQPDYRNTATVSAVSPSPVPPVTVWLDRGCVPVTSTPPRHRVPVIRSAAIRRCCGPTTLKMLCPRQVLCPHHSPTHHSRCCQVLCPRNGRSASRKKCCVPVTAPDAIVPTPPNAQAARPDSPACPGPPQGRTALPARPSQSTARTFFEPSRSRTYHGTLLLEVSRSSVGI